MVKKEKKRGIISEDEFTKENFIEGAIIRPAVFVIAFLTFILGILLLLMGNYKWGGSLIIFSFIFNIYSIYQSFSDEKSIFRTLNLILKIALLFGESGVLGWVLSIIK